ncbi:MAG: ClpXP protease specificity-enhancing factor [Oceanospirillaceae bacterium]|jgi:stringent starvation protein B|nr:ClpXP protease specificity-enhancing factor [Oceanospirillaceae bacterium]
MSVTASRPYLLRALYEWLNDNSLTSHLVVDATVDGVKVPEAFVQDGQITLNIAPGAIQGLLMDNSAVSFNARFSGQPMNVYVPVAAVLAIYARENGVGMGFGAEPGADALIAEPEPEPPTPQGGGGGRPSLKVVK